MSIVIALEDGQPVVHTAPHHAEATIQLVQQWLDGDPHVTIHGNVATFGSEGRGLGVVAYEIGPMPDHQPAPGEPEGADGAPLVQLARITPHDEGR